MVIFEDKNDSLYQNNGNINKKLKREEQIESKEIEFDKSYEKNIRPKTFDEYIGQTALKSTLRISLEASKKKEGAS